MASEPQIGSIKFQYTVPLKPWDGDVELYTTEIEGEIGAYFGGDDDNDEKTVGRIKLLLVKLAEAFHDHADLFCVLDAAGIEDLNLVLFDGDGLFNRDLRIEAEYGDLLVIADLNLAPPFDDAGIVRQAIETAIATFASLGVVVIPKNLLGLSVAERYKCGYRNIKRSDYLVRDNYKLRR